MYQKWRSILLVLVHLNVADHFKRLSCEFLWSTIATTQRLINIFHKMKAHQNKSKLICGLTSSWIFPVIRNIATTNTILACDIFDIQRTKNLHITMPYTSIIGSHNNMKAIEMRTGVVGYWHLICKYNFIAILTPPYMCPLMLTSFWVNEHLMS